MENYNVKSPVLFLIFNRPDVTQTVFNEIKLVKPAKLYIAADGARSNRPGEKELCDQSRSIIKEIDWECEIKILFREQNLGCKDAISSALDWFFENEEEGIILEDDCLPANSFFYFCDILLEKFRNDTRIRHITGCNLQLGEKYGDATTYFSHQTGVWGWASWRRVWKDYDKNLSNYNEYHIENEFGKVFSDRFVIESWTQIFKDLKAGKIDTWDYQLAITNYFNNGLSINPNVNLISNIGFREDATHTTETHAEYANLPLEEISVITYPKCMLPEKEAEYKVLKKSFNLEERWERHNLPRRRLKRWLKNFFN